MELHFGQQYNSRQEISDLLGGDTQKGIAVSTKTNTILLFMNENGIYDDYFYPPKTHDYCMYTGIGRLGHQDSVDNNMYPLNIHVLSHKINGRHLLVFEKQGSSFLFAGEYALTETHQNVQPDANNILRRVFVFHLKQVSDTFSI